MESITSIVTAINDIVWGPPMPIAIRAAWPPLQRVEATP